MLHALHPSFADLELASKKETTRHKRFLDAMERVVSELRWLAVFDRMTTRQDDVINSPSRWR